MGDGGRGAVAPAHVLLKIPSPSRVVRVGAKARTKAVETLGPQKGTWRFGLWIEASIP